MGNTIPQTAVERMNLAKEIYGRVVRPTLQAEDENLIVAIDIHTEDFEIGADSIEICHRLKSRHADATIVGFRLGIKPIDSFRTLRGKVGP